MSAREQTLPGPRHLSREPLRCFRAPTPWTWSWYNVDNTTHHLRRSIFYGASPGSYFSDCSRGRRSAPHFSSWRQRASRWRGREPGSENHNHPLDYHHHLITIINIMITIIISSVKRKRAKFWLSRYHHGRNWRQIRHYHIITPSSLIFIQALLFIRYLLHPHMPHCLISALCQRQLLNPISIYHKIS